MSKKKINEIEEVENGVLGNVDVKVNQMFNLKDLKSYNQVFNIVQSDVKLDEIGPQGQAFLINQLTMKKIKIIDEKDNIKKDKIVTHFVTVDSQNIVSLSSSLAKFGLIILSFFNLDFENFNNLKLDGEIEIFIKQVKHKDKNYYNCSIIGGSDQLQIESQYQMAEIAEIARIELKEYIED